MKNLQQVLREKEKRLLELQQEIEILRNAGQILGAPAESAAKNLNGNNISQPQMIRAILLENARPLHVDELRKKIKERFGTLMKSGDITSVIYRAIRGGALFRKVGVNTFGLVEWSGRRKLRFKMRKSR